MLTAAQLTGIMVRVLLQVQLGAQLIGAMVQVDQQHQLAEILKAGADKGFRVFG
jgi:hypothetical protein